VLFYPIRSHSLVGDGTASAESGFSRDSLWKLLVL